MKLEKCKDNPVLSPNPDVNWENLVTCNPGVIYDNGVFYMLYRAAGDDVDDQAQYGVHGQERLRDGDAAVGAVAGGFSNVRWIDCSRWFMSMGLVRKSRAPLRTARTAESIEASFDSAMKGMPRSGTLQAVSERITSKGIFSHSSEACVSSSAASAEKPSYSRRSRRMFRTLFDRSRIKTFAMIRI